MTRSWKIFLTGLSIRLAGLGLILLGDGHDSVFRKSLVVAGVVLSVGGIGVLKFLLYSGLRKKSAAASTAVVEPVGTR